MDKPSDRSSAVSVDRLRLREAIDVGIGGGGFFLIWLWLVRVSFVDGWFRTPCDTGIGVGEGGCSVIFGTRNGPGVLGRVGGVEIGAGEEVMVLSAGSVVGRSVIGGGFEFLEGMGCAGLL